MQNIFSFPNDLVPFGRHKGRTIGWIIDNDKNYFDWFRKNFNVDEILMDLSEGLDIINREIAHNFIKDTWILQIRIVKYWESKGMKFVRKSKKRIISNTILANYPCEVPYTTTVKEWTEHIDCTKFHNDSVEVERRETIYHYDNKEMEKFIKSKLKLHNNGN